MGGQKTITPKIIQSLKISEKDLNNSKTRTILANLETGLNNSALDDPSNVVLYNKAADEMVIPSDSPKHNTFIVFGRDRLGALSGSGYGALGQPKAGAIDIVVGRQSKIDATTLVEAEETNGVDSFGAPVATVKQTPQDSNAFADASRIYLSQKSDIDERFILPLGATGNSKMRAAIAIKSDDIRIISRNTFKIITNSDNECSNGEMNEKSVGLQLIAVNNKSIEGLNAGTLVKQLPQMLRPVPGQNRGVYINDLQPMVKGDNLVYCLKSIINDIRTLNAVVKGFMMTQDAFNKKVATHTHISPFFAKPTSPSPELVPEGVSTALKLFSQTETGLNFHLGQLQKTEMEYLDNSANVIHINSHYHKLN